VANHDALTIPSIATIHDLADAVRTINDPDGFKRMVRTIGSLPLLDQQCQDLLMQFLANVPHRRDASEVHRHNLASSLARFFGQIGWSSGGPFDEERQQRFVDYATS